MKSELLESWPWSTPWAHLSTSLSEWVSPTCLTNLLWKPPSLFGIRALARAFRLLGSFFPSCVHGYCFTLLVIWPYASPQLGDTWLFQLKCHAYTCHVLPHFSVLHFLSIDHYMKLYYIFICLVFDCFCSVKIRTCFYWPLFRTCCQHPRGRGSVVYPANPLRTGTATSGPASTAFCKSLYRPSALPVWPSPVSLPSLTVCCVKAGVLRMHMLVVKKAHFWKFQVL